MNGPVRQAIGAREWLIAVSVAIAVTGLITVPYALGYAFARPGWESTGTIMNPDDSQSYFAKMLQGYDGAWLYTIPFTTEEHAPAFVGGFYLLLGHAARALGLSLVAMWHLARVTADLGMFLATFGFIATFLPDRRTRWTAYLLAIFGSGLGWLLFLLDQPDWLGWFPVDFKMPEAHLFFSALTFPHVAFGTAIIVLSFCLSLKALTFPTRWRYVVGAGLANVALAIAYPFLIFLIVAILGLYWLCRVVQVKRMLWREAMVLVITFVFPAPLVLYYAVTLATNPVFRAWDAQAITPSPPVPHYLIAYGLMLLLVGLAARRNRAEYAFLWAWVIAVALLVYAPLNPQRRFVEGVQVPLAILAAVGWCECVLPWIAQTRFFRWLVLRPRYSTAGVERLLLLGFLGLMSLSNVYILASVSVTAAVQQPYPLFRASNEIAAVDWLRANTSRSDVVLGAYETGNFIAAHAGNRVVLGHWAETMDWRRKMDEVDRFYDASTDDAWRESLLHQYRVRYVFWSTRERTLGGFDPERAPYLQTVFTNEPARIYRVAQ